MRGLDEPMCDDCIDLGFFDRGIDECGCGRWLCDGHLHEHEISLDPCPTVNDDALRGCVTSLSGEQDSPNNGAGGARMGARRALGDSSVAQATYP